LAAGGSDVTFIRQDELPLAELVSSPHQPRRQMDAIVLQSLVESIQAVGVMQRPRVRERDGRYELVFGHQRAEACRALGFTILPVEVVACDDLTARRMTLHENIKSTALHPIEHAEAICKFLDATLASDGDYALVEGANASERVHRVLTHLTRALPDGEASPPDRDYVLRRRELIERVIREMANKEPKSFLTADVNLLQLPDHIIATTVEKGLKKGHARALGELLAKEPEMFEEVLSRGVPYHNDDSEGWIPLEQAGVGALRNLYKPKKVEQDVSESDAYQTYIPVGVPAATAVATAPAPVAAYGESDLPPWEDGEADEPHAAMFSLPLQSLADAHTTLTTLSAEEWAAMILEAPEGTKNDAKRQWHNLLRWAREVNQALGELD
jgi:ParB/RepB/Spo0J family partition protein